MPKRVMEGHFITDFSHISFRAFDHKGKGYKVSILHCRDFDSGDKVDFCFGSRVDLLITDEIKKVVEQNDTKEIGDFELIVKRTEQWPYSDYTVKIKPRPVQKAFSLVSSQWGDMGKRFLDLE